MSYPDASVSRKFQGMKQAVASQKKVRVVEKDYTDKFALVVVEDNPDSALHTPSISPPPVSPGEKYDPNHIH